MKLPRLDNQNKAELSMIEVAHEILSETNQIYEFSALLEAVRDYLEMSDAEVDKKMVTFYTLLNTDGSFISLGDNRWGLRSWYPIDAIDEEIVNEMDEDEVKAGHKVHHQTHDFLDEVQSDDDEDDYDDDEDDYADDEDAEDYDEDEDEDYDDDEDDYERDSSDDLDDDDDEPDELRSYKQDLEELGDADTEELNDDELEDGLEGDLTVIQDDEDDDEE